MSHQHSEKHADKSTHALQKALASLYLSVKVRSKQEVESYNKEMQLEEEVTLQDTDPFTLIDYIRESIDILMNFQVERAMQIAEEKRKEENDSSTQDETHHDLEQVTQGYEAEIRLHIRVRN